MQEQGGEARTTNSTHRITAGVLYTVPVTSLEKRLITPERVWRRLTKDAFGTVKKIAFLKEENKQLIADAANLK